jgi:hypothetical protein
MLGVRVKIVRYISDDSQPGIVECELEDIHAKRWSFVEKSAIVCPAHLDAQSSYPQDGIIACEIVQRSRDGDRDIIRTNTWRPWLVESVDGSTEFDVLPDAIVDLNSRYLDYTQIDRDLMINMGPTEHTVRISLVLPQPAMATSSITRLSQQVLCGQSGGSNLGRVVVGNAIDFINRLQPNN